ncbi:MAG: asparagine synthase-related protein [Saprospiraceae bacterium]
MHNIALINRDKDRLQKLRNILTINSELVEYYEDNLCFLANRLPNHLEQRREDEDYLMMILGNPVILNGFEKLWDSIHLNELILEPAVIMNLFQHLNGISSILLIDKHKGLIHLVTDPLGYFPLFMYELEEYCIITDNLKSIIFIEDDSLEWDWDSILNYYENGHFISCRTWFKNVRKAEPAKIYSFNSKNNVILESSYWTWEEVSKSEWSKEKLIDLYIKEFSSLFSKVNFFEQNSAIALSGGLDSRWVTYCMNQVTKNYQSFTFGFSGSLDMLIAKKVSKVLKIKWNPIFLNINNWFSDRLELFWQADGLVPIIHFHEGDIYKQIANQWSMVVTGFYGGGIYGGLNEKNERISHKIAHKFLNFSTIEDFVEDKYFNIKSIDPYLSFQKISNLAAVQLYSMTKYFKVLIPFYNMNWLKINYSIDDNLQINSQFYLEALNKHMPEPLRKIIWQKTLLPINMIKSNVCFIKYRISSMLNYLCDFIGIKKNYIIYKRTKSQLDSLIRKLDSSELILHLEPKSIESKMRFVSILLWMKMRKEKRANVL